LLIKEWVETYNFGVPKHSDLEPHYCLVNGNGEPQQPSSLTVRNLVKAIFFYVIIFPEWIGTDINSN